MDKIWYRSPSKSEVIGRCDEDEKKTNDHTEPTKSNAKKSKKQQQKHENNNNCVSAKSIHVVIYGIQHFETLTVAVHVIQYAY